MSGLTPDQHFGIIDNISTEIVNHIIIAVIFTSKYILYITLKKLASPSCYRCTTLINDDGTEQKDDKPITTYDVDLYIYYDRDNANRSF